MVRGDWRERDEERRGARSDPAEREDFGQADYSDDYRYDERARSGYRAEERDRPRSDDFGQADYTNDWAYDAERGRPYRRFSEDDPDLRRREARREDRYERDDDDPRDRREPRSWMDRAGDFLAGGAGPRRRGPSDRVLWAVIVERLKDQRGLDLSDVEVIVRDAEVTLNGTVRRKLDKRRIEDIADIEDVRHVQNNLRVRDRGHWTFL